MSHASCDHIVCAVWAGVGILSVRCLCVWRLCGTPAYLGAVGDRQTTDSDQHSPDWPGGGAGTPTDSRGDREIRERCRRRKRGVILFFCVSIDKQVKKEVKTQKVNVLADLYSEVRKSELSSYKIQIQHVH